MLNHYWLKMVPNYNTKMTRQEAREFMNVTKMPVDVAFGEDRKERNKGVKERLC